MKVKKSREGWKEKAKSRGVKLRGMRKRAKARRRSCEENLAEIERLKKELASITARTSALSVAPVEPVRISPAQTLDPQVLCVLTVIQAVVSFRSIPRILQVFNPMLWARICIPHFTSVINWTLRAGVAVFKQVTPLLGDSPWIAIIDCSIDIGIRKALVILRVPLNVLQNKQAAIGPKDCECIGIELSSHWSGSLVCQSLETTFAKSGVPIAIIKDGGTDLNKGIEIFCAQKPNLTIFTIDDVGHSCANALKALFAKAQVFVKFLDLIYRGAARIRQTTLAWALPPKLRNKGRFLAIVELAHWVQEVLLVITARDKRACPEEARKARRAFPGLSALRPFLLRFCRTCFVVEAFLKLMKTSGLSEDTYRSAKTILKKLPPRSHVRIRLSAWLQKHISIQRSLNFANLPLLVSSDAIESLFGMFKTIIQRNPQAELNGMVYLLPLLCGNFSSLDIQQALQTCSHTQMRQFIQETVPPTLRQLRQRKLRPSLSKSGPKSGLFSSPNSG